MEMIQDQFISAMEAMMRQTDLAMPEEGRKAVKGWAYACQEEFKRFHTYVENGFANLEKHLGKEPAAAPAQSPKPVVAKKKAAPAPKTGPTAK
ncbi:hypothetical protein [Desulfosarcina cetonica]|uniref:hypothetical protein n=1 Tax=Desulfosarcina cetonica TaxID=90730 RepID=UPI0012EE9C79|nr:hypothetical protein [Desulfosarcina cetonica]